MLRSPSVLGFQPSSLLPPSTSSLSHWCGYDRFRIEIGFVVDLNINCQNVAHIQGSCILEQGCLAVGPKRIAVCHMAWLLRVGRHLRRLRILQAAPNWAHGGSVADFLHRPDWRNLSATGLHRLLKCALSCAAILGCVGVGRTRHDHGNLASFLGSISLRISPDWRAGNFIIMAAASSSLIFSN